MFVVYFISPFCSFTPRIGDLTATKTGKKKKPNSQADKLHLVYVFFKKKKFIENLAFCHFFLNISCIQALRVYIPVS